MRRCRDQSRLLKTLALLGALGGALLALVLSVSSAAAHAGHEHVPLAVAETAFSGPALADGTFIAVNDGAAILSAEAAAVRLGADASVRMAAVSPGSSPAAWLFIAEARAMPADGPAGSAGNMQCPCHSSCSQCMSMSCCQAALGAGGAADTPRLARLTYLVHTERVLADAGGDPQLRPPNCRKLA
jgi:hypothetical protein